MELENRLDGRVANGFSLSLSPSLSLSLRLGKARNVKRKRMYPMLPRRIGKLARSQAPEFGVEFTMERRIVGMGPRELHCPKVDQTIE